MKNNRILILEDNIRVLSFLTDRISRLEEKLSGAYIALTILSESSQVKEYINNTEMDFDIILLDRYCKTNGSFHVLDFEKFGVEKIISISSVPILNEEARARGVQRIVHKNHSQIEDFADQVAHEIEEMIGLS
ncbi:hypothetical protein K0B03_01830 [Patescibacteria group bacterium]|nr:hypothetical protein [Patescibacteria group bacterium]